MSCDLNYSEDQRQILDAAAAMLETGYPISRLRDGTRDDLAPLAEFGAFTLSAAESEGGAGFSLVEEALVHVLLGRHLVSTRALATSVAGRLEGGTEGKSICAAIPVEDGAVLLIEPEGTRQAVVFGQQRLALVELEAAGEPVTGLGHGVPLARLEPGSYRTLAESDGGRPVLVADLLVSAQLLGVAQAARDLAVSYAQIRRQFGRPIGSFQAIKHHCADMAIAAEMLSSQLDMAAIACRDERPDAAFQVASLRLLAPKVALANARTCIQIHGGIGFSDEADAHRFLKQAHILSRLGGAAPILDLPAPLAPYRSTEEMN